MEVSRSNSIQAQAAELSRADSLLPWRDLFFYPEGKIYWCGHSLGLQPKITREKIESVLEDWATLGIDGWFAGNPSWWRLDESLKPLMARITGSRPEEVALMNALTVNLHLMLISFFQPTRDRNKILIEENAFPSDVYAVKSQLRLHGLNPEEALIEIKSRESEWFIHTDDILEVLENEGESIALVLLGGVNYLTGQAFEMKKITTVAQSQGCIVGFDLAHAVGNIPLALHDWNVDFAVWCNYKYLNGGPGAIGGCHVHERHFKENASHPRLEGWWGNSRDTQFLMKPQFDPIKGASAWQLSTHSPLLLISLLASLEMFDDVGMTTLRKKSLKLTGLLESAIEDLGSDHFELLTPQDPNQRGCQLSIMTKKNGRELFEYLSKKGVIIDWREPNVIRLAPVPFYNTHDEVETVYRLLKKFLK